MHLSKRTAFGAAAVVAVAFAIPSLADQGHQSGGQGQTKCVDANGNNLDGDVTWSPTTIWPPNHKFVPITVNYSDSDGDGSQTLTVAAPMGTHNQMTDGVEDNGSGNTATDFTPGAPGTASDPGTATTTPQVRSERSGKDGSRIYSITVTCSHSMEVDMGNPSEANPMGQMGTATVTVTVPHDQGNHTGQG